MPVKKLEPPKFKIRFHNDLHTFTECAMCGGKNIKHSYKFWITKEHFFLDRLMDCLTCGTNPEWTMSAGSIGVSWVQHWEIWK